MWPVIILLCQMHINRKWLHEFFLVIGLPHILLMSQVAFVSVSVFTVPLLANRISGLCGNLTLDPFYIVLCQMAVEFLCEISFDRELANSWEQLTPSLNNTSYLTLWDGFSWSFHNISPNLSIRATEHKYNPSSKPALQIREDDKGNSIRSSASGVSRAPWRLLWLSRLLKSLVPGFECCRPGILWWNKKSRTIVHLPPHLTWAPYLFLWPYSFSSALKFTFLFILSLSSHTHYIVFPSPKLLKRVADVIFPIQKTQIYKENCNTFVYNIYWSPHSDWWQKITYFLPFWVTLVTLNFKSVNSWFPFCFLLCKKTSKLWEGLCYIIQKTSGLNSISASSFCFHQPTSMPMCSTAPSFPTPPLVH